jgi:hypothetical protein
MASLADSRIVGIFFPQSLPMHIDIDVVAFNHDPLNPELKGDVLERLEITFSFTLQSLKRLRRHHESAHRGGILLHVGLAEGFHRFVNLEIAFMILRILNRFPAAAYAGDQYDREQDSNRASPSDISRHHHNYVCSIGMGRGTGQAVRRRAWCPRNAQDPLSYLQFWQKTLRLSRVGETSYGKRAEKTPEENAQAQVQEAAPASKVPSS